MTRSDFLISLADRLAGHRWFVSIRRGFLLILPVVMIGALAVLCSEVPLERWDEWMSHLLGDTWRDHIQLAWQASFGVMSMILVAGISHTLASLLPARRGEDLNSATATLVALCSYLVLVMPGNGLLGTEQTGVRCTFIAVFTAIAATELFAALRSLRKPRGNWLNDADPQLPDTLRAIGPAIITVVSFLILHELLDQYLAPANELFENMLFNLFGSIGNDLLRLELFNLISQTLWFFGMHGVNMLQYVDQTWFEAATQANAQAIMLGNAPYEIVTKPFIDAFVMFGGSGGTLGLILALLITRLRSTQLSVARLALLPSLFNINEIVLFGLPVVLNPLYFIPFLLTPLLLTLETYYVVKIGLVPVSIHTVPWTTPIGFSGWLATDSWRGVALQGVNLALAVAIYLPFVRLTERHHAQGSRAVFRELIASLDELMTSYRPRLMSRRDAIGRLARQLLIDFKDDLRNGRVEMMYQPKLDRDGTVQGVEALLRWTHRVHGAIPPNIIVGIAEDAGAVSELGRWTLLEACMQSALWRRDGIPPIAMAVNLSPLQLVDPMLTEHVRQSLVQSGLQAEDLELEITETRNVGNDEQSNASIATLNALGVSLAMDDFGMGYSSLLYMRRFQINAIKLDGSLTREVERNASCQDIIANVSQLCRNMNVRVVAEYVETESQAALLKTLGCDEFQGYLYSPPLKPAECAAFLRTHAAPLSLATRRA